MPEFHCYCGHVTGTQLAMDRHMTLNAGAGRHFQVGGDGMRGQGDGVRGIQGDARSRMQQSVTHRNPNFPAQKGPPTNSYQQNPFGPGRSPPPPKLEQRGAQLSSELDTPPGKARQNLAAGRQTEAKEFDVRPDDKIQWMFGDVGPLGFSMAQKNVLRWSDWKQLLATIDELVTYKDTHRPVEMKIKRTMATHSFDTVSKALQALREKATPAPLNTPAARSQFSSPYNVAEATPAPLNTPAARSQLSSPYNVAEETPSVAPSFQTGTVQNKDQYSQVFLWSLDRKGTSQMLNGDEVTIVEARDNEYKVMWKDKVGFVKQHHIQADDGVTGRFRRQSDDSKTDSTTLQADRRQQAEKRLTERVREVRDAFLVDDSKLKELSSAIEEAKPFGIDTSAAQKIQAETRLKEKTREVREAYRVDDSKLKELSSAIEEAKPFWIDTSAAQKLLEKEKEPTPVGKERTLEKPQPDPGRSSNVEIAEIRAELQQLTAAMKDTQKLCQGIERMEQTLAAMQSKMDQKFVGMEAGSETLRRDSQELNSKIDRMDVQFKDLRKLLEGSQRQFRAQEEIIPTDFTVVEPARFLSPTDVDSRPSYSSSAYKKPAKEQPAMADPRGFEAAPNKTVIALQQQPVNRTRSRSSEAVRSLPEGSTVEVLEVGDEDGRVRARIARPSPGWVSIKMANKPGVQPFLEVCTSVRGFYHPGRNEPCDDLCEAPFLGNFYIIDGGMCLECPRAKGKECWFTNAEAAFQALKFWDQVDRFRDATGEQAFRLKLDLPKSGISTDFSYGGFGSNWKGMFAVLRAKFKNNKMKELLVATGDDFLLEHNSKKGRDTQWSDDLDGSGTNWLGLQLMVIRDELSQKSSDPTSWTQYIWKRVDEFDGKPKPCYDTGVAVNLTWQQTVVAANQSLMRMLS